MSQETLFNTYQALVVDDELIARSVAKRTLGQLGFEVIDADDGTTALELLKECNPDIILLDVEMNKMNGVEACKQIRAHTSFGYKPIIMMTAHDDSESINNAFDAGATDFISKPVNWTLLKHKIKYIMRSHDVYLELFNAERIASIGNWRKINGQSNLILSSGLRRILGISKELIPDILQQVHPDDRQNVELFLADIKKGKTKSLIHRIIDANKNTIVVDHRSQPLTSFNGEIRGALGTIQDITEQEKVSARAHQLAYHDPITKLFNRAAMLERLEHHTQNSHLQQSRFSLLHIDVDNFKRINDSLGPEIGDSLLQAVADRLQSVAGNFGCDLPEPLSFSDSQHLSNSTNMIARLGADAFAILVMDTQAFCINAVSKTLVFELGKPYAIANRELTVSVSIGVANYPEHGKSASEINQKADTALHAVKLHGKNDFKVYDGQLSEIVQNKMQMEEYLRLALQNNELSLNYQPQIDISDLHVIGAEALLRWKSDALGHVSPADFIPLAEEIGLIVPIGNWVLNTACMQLAQWNQNHVQLPRLAVNISIRQFNQSDFVEVVSNTIESTGVDPRQLELEITESLLAVDVASAIDKLEALKALGVEISVDDFGTGYSSLSYLKKFPIDRLKIDQSFVRDIHKDKTDVAITRSIIGLARGLSLCVIAEGVETNEHLAKLTELGCDEAQGYLIARPMPHVEFIDWLQNYNPQQGTDGITKVA